MTDQNETRIESMYAGDRRWAYAFVLLLWLAVAFVFFMIMPFMDSTVTLVLGISAALLLLFNTASILAMVAHYAEDKTHIYGLDIFYLDQMKK